MTNREEIIMALQGKHDDWAHSESVIAYRIACPHYAGQKGLPCDELEYPWSTPTVCGPCIQEWLDAEVSE